MAYKNGVEYHETTKSRRLARPPLWVHISFMPDMKRGEGVTFKKAKPLPKTVKKGEAL